MLGVLVDAVDYRCAIDQVMECAQAVQPLSVSALAVHGVMTGVLDRRHRYRLNHLDLVVPDGQPVRWALNWLHSAKLEDRVYGPVLMQKLCQAAERHQLPIYFYGSDTKVLVALRKRLSEQFPSLIVAGAEPSKFRPISAPEKAAVVQRIRASGARMVFVGLGCPRQEVWAYEYRDALGLPTIAVGAAFGFLAGLLTEAPPVLQRLGFEWASRLWHEPRRLWRRYLLLNPAYVLLLALQASGLWARSGDVVGGPPELMNHG